MKIKWKKIKKDLEVNKEGIAIGGVVGYIVSQFLKSNPDVLSAAMATQGLLDNFLGEVSVATASTKLQIIMVITFAFVGYLVDRTIDPKK